MSVLGSGLTARGLLKVIVGFSIRFRSSRERGGNSSHKTEDTILFEASDRDRERGNCNMIQVTVLEMSVVQLNVVRQRVRRVAS